MGKMLSIRHFDGHLFPTKSFLLILITQLIVTFVKCIQIQIGKKLSPRAQFFLHFRIMQFPFCKSLQNVKQIAYCVDLIVSSCSRFIDHCHKNESDKRNVMNI